MRGQDHQSNQISKLTLCCITAGTVFLGTFIGALVSIGMKESRDCDDCESRKLNILPIALGGALGIVAPLFSYGLFRYFLRREEGGEGRDTLVTREGVTTPAQL